MGFSIVQLDRDARTRFGDLVIDDLLVDGKPVTLVHSLRLDEERNEVLKSAPELSEVSDMDELIETYHIWARAVAETPKQAEALIEAIGKRIDMWAELQVQWSTRTQPGEASTSES